MPMARKNIPNLHIVLDDEAERCYNPGGWSSHPDYMAYITFSIRRIIKPTSKSIKAVSRMVATSTVFLGFFFRFIVFPPFCLFVIWYCLLTLCIIQYLRRYINGDSAQIYLRKYIYFVYIHRYTFVI